MDLIQIYECFCDRTRLRILHLLTERPLCVCHFQEILEEPQVKISKHLAYLRGHEMVATERRQNWIIYSLPKRRDAQLVKNLKCLQDCAQSDPIFKSDLKKLKRRKTEKLILLRQGFGATGKLKSGRRRGGSWELGVGS